MNPEKLTDRRIVRTRQAIRDALVALIEEKGFDSLLVSDIAGRANINRGTFYLHYQDKFDLLDKTQDEIIDHIENIILQTNKLNLSDFDSVDKPLPVVVALFEYLLENKALMHAIINLHSGLPFQDRIRKVITKNLDLNLLTVYNEKNFIIPKNYMISYALSAHFGVILEWLENGCVETPHEMAVILGKISWYGPLACAGIKPL